jgi:LacI family transcriptional regulator
MQDVANHAGVSLGTVSNTINSPDKVREKTRLRVQASIDALGFVRNDAARSLAAGTSSTIGLIIVDMGNSFFVDIARGAEAAVRDRGMNLLIANSDIDLAKQMNYLDVFEQARVAGILLAPLDTPQAGSARSKTVSRPMVLVNYASEDGSYSSVVVDEREGGYLAAKHLIGLGRRNLVFAGGPSLLKAVTERWEGVCRAVDESAGATLRRVETTGLNIRHGRRAAEEILALPGGRPNGIVAASDLVAVGCIQVLEREEHLAVPEDIAIVGYDNNHFASESSTPVSTISQPGEEMGRAAAEILLAEIETRGAAEKLALVLEPHLVARRSTLGATWRSDL